MERLLLTIEGGPRDHVEVAVPGDRPIGEVIPMVRDLLVAGAAGRWQPDVDRLAVGQSGKGVLPRDRTLIDCGVEDGATLYVCEVEPSNLANVPHAPVNGESKPAAEPAAPAAQGWVAPGGRAPAVAAAAAEPVKPAAGAPDPPPPASAAPGVAPAAATAAAISTPAAPSPPDAAAPAATAPAAPPLPTPTAAETLPAVPAVPAAAPAAAVAVVATRRAGLPDPQPLSERLRDVTSALVGQQAPAAAPAGKPEGKNLSRPQRAAAIDRALTAWEESDYRSRLDGVITGPRLRRCPVIAVVSPKGGVGKTTTSILLGTMFAMLRNDRVVAVDSSPDHGTLGRSLTPEHPVSVNDFLNVLEHPALTATLLDSSLGRGAHGLMVLPAPTDPERMMALDDNSYIRVIDRLRSLVGLLVLDCGAGLFNPATRAALDSADQVVVVGDSDALTASVVAEAAQRLIAAGASTFVVVNRASEGPGELDQAAFARHLSGARAVVRIPNNRPVARRVTAGDFNWQRAPRSWQVAVRQLTAALALDWTELGLAA